jgi:hypothetical protein
MLIIPGVSFSEILFLVSSLNKVSFMISTKIFGLTSKTTYFCWVSDCETILLGSNPKVSDVLYNT